MCGSVLQRQHSGDAVCLRRFYVVWDMSVLSWAMLRGLLSGVLFLCDDCAYIVAVLFCIFHETSVVFNPQKRSCVYCYLCSRY